MKGYFEIGIYHTKTEQNIGTLWRSASQLGAKGIFTIGRRYKYQASDTCKAFKKIPLRHYVDFEDFYQNIPIKSRLVGIEMGGTLLGQKQRIIHPAQAVYLLGSEDNGLPLNIINRCHNIISLGSVSHNSYNVSVAGSIVMYHGVFLNNKRMI